jgi:acetoacetate decarboxylase
VSKQSKGKHDDIHDGSDKALRHARPVRAVGGIRRRGGFETYTSAISYTTDRDAVAPLLPEWFEPADEPTVTFNYTRLVGMKWMGGRNYNIVSVGTNAVCTAGDDPPTGSYGLAIWESDAAPILAVREYMGSPKLMAKIADVDVFADSFSFRCTEYDAALIEGSVTDVTEMSADELAPIVEAGQEIVGLNWKYIPGLDGEPDVNYPTALYMQFTYERGARGTGNVSFGSPDDQEAPYSSKIVRVLSELPLHEQLGAVSLYSSYSYLFRKRTRRLDT